MARDEQRRHSTSCSTQRAVDRQAAVYRKNNLNRPKRRGIKPSPASCGNNDAKTARLHFHGLKQEQHNRNDKNKKQLGLPCHTN